MDGFLNQVFTDQTLLARAKREWTVDKDQFRNAARVPDWMAYFLYHPYDEEALKRTLEEHTGWQRPKRRCYFIDFDPRLPFTLLGPVLKSAIEKPIRKSLEKLSKRYSP